MDFSANHLVAFHGLVETTVHALRIIHAAHLDILPRVSRRLNDNERHYYIKSGSVFVFSVQESGIRRWTDGRFWTPSRIADNFLIYRELREKAPSRNRSMHSTQPSASPFTTGVSRDYSHRYHEEPALKPGGLLKKTISVHIDNKELHLVAYYTLDDLNTGVLRRPTSCPRIMTPHMSPAAFCLPSFRVPPTVVIGLNGTPRLAGDVPEGDGLQVVKRESHEPPLALAFRETLSPYIAQATTGVPNAHLSNQKDMQIPWSLEVQESVPYWGGRHSPLTSHSWQLPGLPQTTCHSEYDFRNAKSLPIDVSGHWTAVCLPAENSSPVSSSTPKEYHVGHPRYAAGAPE